jgi:hypothetical protein
VPVRPLVKVSLPLNLTRGLLRALESSMVAYEQAFGQPVPDQPLQAQAEVEQVATDASEEAAR